MSTKRGFKSGKRTIRWSGSTVIAIILLLGMISAATAEIKLPPLIKDNMVLQQGCPVPIWGQANPGEKITVTFGGQTKTAITNDKGDWRVTLAAMRASAKPRELIITSPSTIDHSSLIIRNVLVGEVWVCSGQSNMQFGVGGSNNAQQEIVGANFPEIRLFTVPCVISPFPQTQCGGQWTTCSPDTVAGFSAVGFFFGRHLHQNLKVPIGLINTSWGGTVAEAWTSAEALKAKLPEFNTSLDEVLGPGTSFKQAQEAYQKKMVEFDKSLQRLYNLEDDLTAATKLATSDVDDSSWGTMKLPINWENAGLPNVDGIVWFRKIIEVPEAWAGKELILRLGPVDEVDVTWFNGVQVGARGCSRTGDVSFWNIAREYHVPGKLVKPGKNVIAVRVIDCNGAGGLWGDPAETMFVELVDGTDKTRIQLSGEWRYFAQLILPQRPQNPDTPNRPSVIFNAMINPLIPFAIKGAIWYQGESNADRAVQYRTLLPTMITDWRTRWGQGEFTFLIVQLANFMDRGFDPEESAWAELREAQTMTAAKLPKTGLAVIIDIGDSKDIHPKNKQDVGTRLGLAARAIAYRQRLEYSGPVYREMKVIGDKVSLTFLHTEGGLKTKGESLKGFSICGSDKKYVWAQAEIQGKKVIVWSDKVAKPVAVRYAWANNPDCNLTNGADLPAVPFRTDGP